jgi:carbonic anhydrase
MRLLEAILESNSRAVASGSKAELVPSELADALPVVALTCIDARLNALLPEKLGVPEEKFVWLRNAGNVITAPLSSTMRSLALACAVKGGKEILILGHTDCQIAKGGAMQLLDGLARMGVERARLPENLTEYFGVFASERQNVIKACEIVRSSPLIGPKVSVHGLIIDVQTGKLECLVNGYESFATTASEFTTSLKAAVDKAQSALGEMQDFKIGEMKFPDTKIGQVAGEAEQILQKIEDAAIRHPEAQTPKELATEMARDFVRHIVRDKFYKVIGDDRKVYGPIRGDKLLQWIAEDRIDQKTPVQVEGGTEWAPLGKLGDLVRRAPIPLPPPLQPKMSFKVRRPGRH